MGEMIDRLCTSVMCDLVERPELDHIASRLHDVCRMVSCLSLTNSDYTSSQAEAYLDMVLRCRESFKEIENDFLSLQSRAYWIPVV